MSMKIYTLSGGDVDVTKVLNPLDLGMKMKMNIFYGDGDWIMKHVLTSPVVIYMHNRLFLSLVTFVVGNICSSFI